MLSYSPVMPLHPCRDYSGNALSSMFLLPQEKLCFPAHRIGRLTIAQLSDRDKDIFVETVAVEVGSRYPDTGERYAHEILNSCSEGNVDLASSSMYKLVVGCYISEQLLGFTVITPKRGGRIKFGPTVVLPHARGSGIACLLREVGESHFCRLGFLYAYSTCREDNKAARAYVSKVGYDLVGNLEGQYSPGISELVYAKRLPGYWRSNIPLSRLEGEASSFTLKCKRGGATKIEIHKRMFSSGGLADNLDYAIAEARKRGARRVYLKIPVSPEISSVAKHLALKTEGLGLPDYRGRYEVLLARSLER